MGLNWLIIMYMLNGLMVNKWTVMEHSDNEFVEEEDEVTDDEGSEDGGSDGDDDDMDDQDWWVPCTFHYYDLILVSRNLFCFEKL